MAKSKSNRKKNSPLYKVGDLVSFAFGDGIVTGKVVEDRGRLGVGGRRLYGIKWELIPGELTYIEIPEVELNAGVVETQRK